MIVEASNDLKVVSSQASIKATISESSLPFIFKLLSQNFYSNALGSLIREYTSNCLDSHTEAGVEVPVLVRREFITEESAWDLIFEDFGMGLSTDRMLNIFMDYGNSTKRTDNEMIGGFGLGSKSGLSYQESFTITTRYGGIEYKYIYSRGEVEPTLISLHGYDETKTIFTYFDEDAGCDVEGESVKYTPIGIETEKGNGTEIRIRIKSGDNYNLEGHVKKQLAYFQNINFKGFSGLVNDYTIYELRTFFYRKDVSTFNNKLHIVLGQVAYPINYNTLGINDIYINVGLKFQIGELRVTPNREELIYDSKAIDLIKRRIDEFKLELVGLADKQKGIDDMQEFIKKCNMDEIPITLTEGVILTVDKKYLPKFRFVFNPVPEIKTISKYVYSHFFTHTATIYDSTYNIVTGNRAETYGIGNYNNVDMIVTEEDQESPIANKFNLAYLREKGHTSRQLNIFRMLPKNKFKRHILLNLCSSIGMSNTVRVYTGHNAKSYKQNIEDKKVVGKFVAYMLQKIAKEGIFFKNHLPTPEWIEDYKERTKVIRTRKAAVPLNEMTFNCMQIDPYQYESNKTMTYGSIANYEYVVYCIHSLTTTTPEKRSISGLLRIINYKTATKQQGKYLTQMRKNVIFISISQTNYDMLEAKGLTNNFVYYQDVFQIPYFKRIPQHIHYIKQYEQCSGTIKEVYSPLKDYGEIYKKGCQYLSNYVGNKIGYSDSDVLTNFNLDPYNLPYEPKNDRTIDELLIHARKVYSNKVSHATINMLHTISYGRYISYVKVLLLSKSQISGLHPHCYSAKQLKTLID